MDIIIVLLLVILCLKGKIEFSFNIKHVYKQNDSFIPISQENKDYEKAVEEMNKQANDIVNEINNIMGVNNGSETDA
jgi:peptidoglycan hydrolase CwlO-like protein